MRRIIRILGLLLVPLGVVVGYFAWREWVLASHASVGPEGISVQDLENGPPANPYRTIGTHIVLYPLVLVQPGLYGGPPTVWYPIISSEEFTRMVNERTMAHHGSQEDITPIEQQQHLEVKILVKTNRYPTVEAVQAAVGKASFPSHDLNGLVVNQVEGMNWKQEGLLRKNFTGYDPHHTVIFEEDRVPMQSKDIGKLAFGAFAFVAAGIAMCCLKDAPTKSS